MNKKLISMIISSTLIISSLSTSVLAKNFDSKQNVALDHAWTVNFNQKVNVNEAFEGVYIKDSKGNKIPTRVDFSEDHTKMIITPSDGYAPNSSYTLNVEGVSDEDGKPLSDKATMQFTTATTAQVGNFDIISVTANNDQGDATTNLDPNSSFSFQLSKNVNPSTVNNVTVTDKDGNKANVKVEVTGNSIGIVANNNFEDDTKTITVPRNTYKCNTTYTINLNGVKSTDGQDIGTKTYTFTTRDYKLNPTISGICNDDYISFGSKYASDLYQIPYVLNGVSGYAVSLQPCHDNNGTLVLDKSYSSQNIDQITNGWNPYANLQNRNIVNLQVELRKEYQKILAKDTSYAGHSVGFCELPPDISKAGDSTGEVIYQYAPNVLDSMPRYPFQLYSMYNTRQNLSFYGVTELDSAATSTKPQVAMCMTSMPSGTDWSLTKLALYQSLYCMLGGDIANEAYDYIINEETLAQTSGDTAKNATSFHTIQLGQVTMYAEGGIFLFKY